MGQERGSEISHEAVSFLNENWDSKGKVFKIPAEAVFEGEYYEAFDPYFSPEKIYESFREAADSVRVFVSQYGESEGRERWKQHIRFMVEENVSLVRFLKKEFGWDVDGYSQFDSSVKVYDVEDSGIEEVVSLIMDRYGQ